MRRVIRDGGPDEAIEAVGGQGPHGSGESSSVNSSLFRARIAFAVLSVLVYGIAAIYMGGLSFDPVKDEQQFWEQITDFVEIWPPGIADLQNYGEPMTPLSFLFWAGLEALHGLGIGVARFTSILIGLGLLALIGMREPSPQTGRYTPLLAAAGMMAFPYWIPLSLLLYTDLPATVFVALGCLFYYRERNVASAICFVLGIATRQYVVVFPLAVLAHEGLRALRGSDIRFDRVVPQALAALTLLGWVAFFGGVGPADGLAEWPRHENALNRLNLAFSLYFLAATGAYFVIPEWVIDRFHSGSKLRIDRTALIGCGLLLVAFAIDTPNYPTEVGPLNRTIAFILNPTPFADVTRTLLIFALACAAVVRFARFDFATWVVLGNTALMAFMWSPWEKYCMPMLGALWMLKALGALEDREVTPAVEEQPAAG